MLKLSYCHSWILQSLRNYFSFIRDMPDVICIYFYIKFYAVCWTFFCLTYPGIILVMGSANERRCYNVMPSLIG